jgi:uncharacterized membrane protein
MMQDESSLPAADMTDNPSVATRHRVTRALPATDTRDRKAYVDVFRGLLISHMALDHASLFFNAGRGAEELAAAATAPASSSLMQFLTRFTGVPVAPGFFFMAGFMVAVTTFARENRGVAPSEVTRRLLIRGLVLIAVDAVVMGLPRALMGFYSFMVLSSIGVAIIAVALLRNVPSRILVVGALAVLALHPLIDVSSLPVALQAIVYEPVRTGAVRSLYPIIPWIAIVVLGFVVGRDSLQREHAVRFWSVLAVASLVVFGVVRLSGGYGNAYAYDSIASEAFWSFAKYPPDLAFLSWSFACIFLTLAALRTVAARGTPRWLRPLEIFGRVPFFFYVVHFYVLGIAAALLGTRVGLAETYAIWIALLIVMTWPCMWYYRKKRERPNLITRYF